MSSWMNQVFFILKKLKKNPLALMSAVVIMIFVILAVFAPWAAPHSSTEGDLLKRFVPPVWLEGGSAVHVFGTDAQGMDLLSRVIFGARISIVVGLLATGISVFVGTSLGLLAGYFRGWLDQIISRIAELLLAFPFLIFAIGMMAFLGPGFWNLILALSFIGWVEFFRITRGEIMSEKPKEYIEAAMALGRTHIKIMLSEALPNIVHSLFVLATLRLGYMIIMEASLSFLGLGIQPPNPAWGSMISVGRDYMLNAWWIATIPGIVLLMLVLSINLLGEGLRDILDPRLKLK